MSNFPSVRPSLNLQFDSQPTPADMTSHLASVGATFSRASIGTYTDANGLIQEATAGQARPNYSTAGVHEGLLIEEARTNLIEASEDLTDSNWGKEADVSVLENQAIAPNGKASADKLVYSSTNEFHRLSYALSVTSGTTYSFSAYVKADGYNFVLIRWQGFVSGGQDNVSFDLVDVETDVVSSNFDSASIEAVGNDWYKITVVGTAYDNSSSIFRIRFQPTAQTDGSIDRFTGDGESGGFVWGAQLEAGSFPTSYIPTIPTFNSRASTATYFDSSGVLQTASSGVARTDHKYIDGQWVEAGLLLEGASTNLVTDSEDLNTFTKTNTTVTSNQINGLDGTLTADELTESSDATAQNHRLSFNTPSLTSGNDYTMSVFAKNNGRDYLQLTFNSSDFSVTQYATFNLSTGVIENAVDGTAEIQDVGNGWYRCSFTSDCTSSGASTIFFILSDTASGRDPSYIGDGTSGVYLWGAQIEEQSQTTSYIPTSGSSATRSADVYTTATKTRSADVCYIDGTAFTDFYNQEQGTFFIDYRKYATVNQSGSSLYIASDGTNNNRIGLTDNNTGGRYGFFAISSGALQFSSSATFPTTVANTRIKLIGSFTSTNANAKDNTNVSFSDSGSYTLPNVSEVSIGYDSIGDSKQLNGAIKKMIFFPRQLSDNELIKLTQ